MPPRNYRDFPLAYCTEDLPGVGGVLKREPEDFQVFEVPAYAPQGQGDHLFVHLEKRDLSTPELVQRLSRELKIKPMHFGVAGRKDKRAITRQWISVPPNEGKRFREEVVREAFEKSGVTILEMKPHGQKLRTGHLKGNQFTLVLRGVEEGALAKATAIIEKLQQIGMPNFFGSQRFGDRGKNVARGRALLENEGQSAKGGPRGDRRFDLSAWQSDLFNRYLKLRIEEGLYTSAIMGDVLKKHDTGGLFHCEAPEVDKARVESLQVSPTGPLFGGKMMEARDASKAREDRVLEDSGIRPEQLASLSSLVPGGRRICRVALSNVSIEPVENGLKFLFFLPKGSYATVLLGEIQKVEVLLEEESQEE
jgi:tRNA pseudouridine13 synthase